MQSIDPGKRVTQSNDNPIFGRIPQGSYESVTFDDEIGVCITNDGTELGVAGEIGGFYAVSFS